MGRTRLSCKLAYKMGAGQQGDNRRPAFTSEARKEDGKMMRALRSIAIAVPALFVAGLANSQGIEWETLNQEVMDLYRAGRYDRAVVVAKKALEVAERSVGQDHPNVATSLNNLAGLYRKTKRNKEAELLEAEAARIRTIER